MLTAGDTFERYTIDGMLGEGGMGTVYRARDTRLERRVAVKVIADTATGSEGRVRLLREAKTAAALDHPNVVSIFDVGEVDGTPYIVMELVLGHTLRELIGGTTPMATRIRWLADVARALGAAQKRGLIHRDVKPENVMVRDDGVVKVLDFGIARRVRGEVDPSAPTQASPLPTLTMAGVTVGTPVYMSPEQIRGKELDGRSDQFAWGVLAHELLTGRLPWEGNDPLAIVASVLTDEPDAVTLDDAGAPPEVRDTILRTLRKQPDARFPSMDEVVRVFDGDVAAKGETGASLHRDASPQTSQPASRPPSSSPPLPQPGATQLQRFSSGEVRQVLARAIEQQEERRPDTRLGFDDLVAAAREVGVSETVMRDVSRELRQAKETEPLAATETNTDYLVWRRRKRRSFVRHLGVYLAVNAVFLIFGLMSGKLFPFLQPALWWAIGLVIHGLRAFMVDEDDFRDAREKHDRHERRRNQRRAAVDRVVQEGADVLLKTGQAIRKRIATTKAPDPTARLRVETQDTNREELDADTDAPGSRTPQRRK